MKKINDFNNWMLKIKNIHYSDNEQMYNAYQRLEDNEKTTN